MNTPYKNEETFEVRWVTLKELNCLYISEERERRVSLELHE